MIKINIFIYAAVEGMEFSKKIKGYCLGRYLQITAKYFYQLSFFWNAWPSKNFASLGFSGWQNNLDISGVFLIFEKFS